MSIVVAESAELRRLISEAVESAVARSRAADEWVDGHTSPLGRRAFLKLARAGAFPASLVGNKYMARRSDVDAYLDRQRIHPVPPPEEVGSGAPSTIQPGAKGAPDEDPVARALAAGRLRVLKKVE